MTDKEIDEYYKTHQPKPKFLSYNTFITTIHYAYANSQNYSLPLLILINGASGA